MFSQTTKYGLRLMTCMAREPHARHRSADLAEATAVPRAYVSKIMKRLESAALVHSQKGRGGGFWLARPPNEIALSNIMHALDDPLLSGVCVFGWGNCDANNHCDMHDTWSSLNTRVRDWATQTLADVVKRQPERGANVQPPGVGTGV